MRFGLRQQMTTTLEVPVDARIDTPRDLKRTALIESIALSPASIPEMATDTATPLPRWIEVWATNFYLVA